MWAGHLVAMTENSSESILLLDDRGCPTNFNIFPALTKISNNDTKRLVATFQAFRFSSSPIVRFSVIVQFCPEKCPSVSRDGFCVVLNYYLFFADRLWQGRSIARTQKTRRSNRISHNC
jgi:hypothetical protein